MHAHVAEAAVFADIDKVLVPADTQPLVDPTRANANGPVVAKRRARRLCINYNARATSKGDNPN